MIKKLNLDKENKIFLRMDDVGASTKLFEVYSKKLRGFGNILWLKYLPYFKAWGPYNELSVEELNDVFNLLRQFDARLTIGITACWVNKSGQLTPYNEMFPDQAAVIKAAAKEGLVEIANHGLTHCVHENLEHLPRKFTSNRTFHREFWSWRPKNVHFEHVAESQMILEKYFEEKIVTLIPPGNVFCEHTLDAAYQNGISIVNCNTKNSTYKSVKVCSDEQVFPFHDREIVLEGVDWLRRHLVKFSKEGKSFCLLREASNGA